MQEPRALADGRSAIFARGLARAAVLLLAFFAAMQAAQAQVKFNGVQTTLASGFAYPSGVAVDGSGNVFVGDRNVSEVDEILAVNGRIPPNPTINVLGGGFLGPEGVAVDTRGNVYVADYDNSLVKEIPASCIAGANNASCVLTLGSGFSLPATVAVDGSGNVFVADYGNSEVKEIPASCIAGANNASCVLTLGSGFNVPEGVAVDGSGNVFVGDAGNNEVKEILAVNGSVPATPQINILGGGFNQPYGVAVDASGNVYVADTGNNEVKEIPASCIAGANNLSCVLTLGSGFDVPWGVAVDGRGNVYVGDAVNARVVELALTSVNFGAQAVGAASAAISLPFTIEVTTVGSITVLTTGDAGLDFANAGTGTCTPQTYGAATNCTVNVTFTPLAPGLRKGAVEILDGAGNVLASVYVYGTGTGPAVAFSPTTPIALGSAFAFPLGVAVDDAGNVFVADSHNSSVKEMLATGGYTTINTLGSGFNLPYGVAVDGAGNVFVADTLNNEVKEILAAGGYTTVNILGSGFDAPDGLAVDGSGNVYVADTVNKAVKEILAVGGYTTVNILGSGFKEPVGVAVDGSGNVFVADASDNAVKEILAAGGYTTVNVLGSGFNSPTGVAVDASGNVVVGDFGNNAVKEILAASGYATVNTLAAGLDQPWGVAVDGAGNVYVGGYDVEAVTELPRSQPPAFAFGSTNVGTTSSSSPQSATVQNIGNTALTVTSLTFSDAVDFAQVASSGTPEDCTGTIMLAPSAECNLSVSFTPQSVGALGGTVTLTNNALNVPGATQATQLSGIGVALAQTIIFNTIPGQFVGRLLDLPPYARASSELPVSFASTTPTICTVTGTTATMIAAGNCTIQASQAGNAVYAPATPVMQTFTVSVPSLTATTLAVIIGGAPVTTVTSGSVITLTATVVSGAATVTAGTVNFCNAAATYCTDINLLGTAQLTMTGTASISLVPGIGSHSYKAVFTAVDGFTTSASAASPLAVTGTFPTTTTIASSGAVGEYTLTATVSGLISSPIGAVGPAGTVSFLDTSYGNYPVATAALGTGTLGQGFAPQVPYATGFQPYAVAVWDFNGDGIPDLAVTNSANSTLSVLLGAGNGTFGAQVEYGTGPDPVSVTVGDFNGDGIPDLAVANYNENAVSVLLGNGNGTFQTQLTYFTGDEPYSVVAGDFNGDGILDLAVANFGDGTVSILLGTGGGGFANQVTYATGANPISVAVGDFNGDGTLDLAVANNSGNSVSVLLGNGDGTFQTQATYPTGTAPYSVKIGDLNGDGFLDLAVANYGDNTVSVLLGNGNGTFAAQVAYATGREPFSVTIGDFNADGIPDLAVANYLDATASVLFGNGNGTFTAQFTYVTGNQPESVAAADFNGDGLPDLAIVNNGSNAVSVLLNQLTETATATATGVYFVGTGNPDGHLVAANYPGAGSYGASVSATTALGAELIPTTLTLTTSATTVAVGGQVTLTATLSPYMAQGSSTNGESVEFIVYEPNQTLPLEATLAGGVATLNLNLTEVGTTTVSAYYPGADNAFVGSTANNVVITVTPPTTTTALAILSGGNAVTTVASGSVATLAATVVTGPEPVTTGTVNFCNAAATDCTDINLIGTAQLTAAGTASISFVPGIGSHSYKAVFVGTTGMATSASAASPLAVTGTYPTTTTIAAGGAPGDYTLTATLVGAISSSIGATGPTGSVSFLNTSNANYSLATAAVGAGTLAQGVAPEVSYATGLVPQSAAVGDFNRDGIPDVVVANGSGNTVSVLLGNANGTLQPQVTYATGTYSTSVAVADFNGDGFLDLAVANLVDNTVSVLLGNGDGTFQPQVTYPVGTAPASVAVGDFNGDGIPDLAVANTDSDLAGVSVLLGKGDGTFNAQVTYPTGGLPQSVAVGDFNGDGFPDLAVTIPSNNTVSVLFGKGDGTFNAGVPYATGSGPYSAAVGDFNGDGISDLAVANHGDNTVSVLLGNGAGTFKPQVPYATGNNPISVAVGDFNGDGIPDLALANSSGNTLSVLLGNGDGTFQTQVPYGTGNGPQSVAVGDFNGDGLSDLVVADTGSNAVSVLLNQLTETATATANGIAVAGNGVQNIEASYPGDANYSTSVSATTPLTAQPLATTLTLSASPANITFGQSAMLTATLNPYTSQGYTTNGEIVTFMNNGAALGTAVLQTGTATLMTSALQGGANQLAASFAGDANFAAAPGAEAIVVNPAGQTITFSAIGGQVVGTPLTLTASASSGLAVSFTSSTTGVCTVAGNAAAMLTIGTCSLTASQAGNGNYAAATPVSQSFAVAGVPQTITFTGLPGVAAYTPGLAYTLNGVASSGLPVSYTVTGPATLSASTLTISGAGTVVVTASQPGNTMYAAATPVAQTTVVVLAPSIVSQPNIGVSGINPGQTATITVTATGTPPLLYQWFQGTSPITTNPIQGAVNSSYTTPPLTVATNYWVQISNLGGVVDSATLLVYVNQPPVCTLSVAGTSTALQVSATASCADPQNELLTATINWGDGTSGPLTGTTQLHTYSAPGTYTVVVTATNTSGLSGSAQQRITPNRLPICTLGVVQGTAATYAVTVPASCTDPQNEALTATINWGDGTIAPATNNASNAHAYANNGIYTVVLSATDTSGLIGVSVPQPVNVLAQATPIAPGGSAPVSGTGPPPPAAAVGTQVTFICSNVSATVNGQTVNNALPSQYGISCTSPTITLTPATTPISVSIQTTTATTATAENRDSDTTRVICAVVFPLPGLALLLLGTLSRERRRRRRDQWLAIGMVAVLCFGLTSCGGSFTPPPVAATPAGQYYITVVETVVNPPAPTGFVQTSLIVPLPVTSSAGN